MTVGEKMKKEKNESKFDQIVLLVCIVLIGAFVVILPNLNSMAKGNQMTPEVEKEPSLYHCKMTKEEETYVMKQDATYKLENQKIVEAQIEREYVFSNLESYQEWKEQNGKSSNIKGQIEVFSFDEQNLKIIKKIDKDILVIDEDDLDSTFPKTYSNLLIYTKDQECDVTYKE